MYTFRKMVKPLMYPVVDGKARKILIPAGTTDVEIAYGESSKTYIDKKTGQMKRQNVYRWNGEIYNA